MTGQVVKARLVCKAIQTLGKLGPSLHNRQPLHQIHVMLDNQPIHPTMGYVPYWKSNAQKCYKPSVFAL